MGGEGKEGESREVGAERKRMEQKKYLKKLAEIFPKLDLINSTNSLWNKYNNPHLGTF